MELKVLVDNNTFIDQYYFGEPAWSCYIESKGRKILMDTGYSDIFIKNADMMGIDLSKVNDIVISHGHNDHTRGMKYLFKSFDMSEKNLIAAPGCFDPKCFDNLDIGSPFSEKDLRSMTNLVISKKPYFLTDELVFLGEIPDRFDFEKRLPIGVKLKDGEWIKDFNYDDSALCLKTDNGIVIITACSHSGICNITEYAKEVLGDSRILGIIGGFHLFEVDQRLKNTTAYLAKQKPEFVCPAHCVSLKAKIYMSQALPICEVGVNLSMKF